MRFLLDMGISPKCTRFLEGLGHEAVHVAALGLHRAPDTNLLEKALADGAVVLTHDLDFPQILANSGAALPSVVVFRLSNMKSDNVCRYLSLVLDQIRAELEEGVVVSVTDHRLRHRKLPLG